MLPMGERGEVRVGQRCVRIRRDVFDRPFHVRELRLDAGGRLTEQAQLLEETHHVTADAARRLKVHDFDRDTAADPIEPADALLHDRGLPGKVEHDEATAEFEIASLTPALGGDEQARTIGIAKQRDFRIATRR